MTIRHLKIFVAVVDCGKMREAAKLLFVSQPSISQAIAELESHYGVKLFERISQRLYLTEKGKSLYPYAKNAVNAFEATDALMKNVGSSLKLRIGASVTVGTCVINNYINELELQYNNLETSVFINNTTLIEDMIRDCKLDVAVIEGIVLSEDVVKIPLFNDELVIVAGKSHPYYNEEIIEIEMLDGQPFVSREVGSVERNQFENLLKDNNIVVNRHWECSSTEAIKNAVISGRGLAIMSRLIVDKEIKDGSLKVIKIHDVKLVRQIQLIYHKDKFISDELQKFIDICKNYNY